MAQGKKSVLLYCDLIHTVEKLTDEQAGKFFKHYLRYINDQDPVADDPLVDILFEHVKHNLKRDLKKWESTQEERSNSGALGNLKRWHKDLYSRVKKSEITLEEALVELENRKSSPSDKNIASVAVNVNDNVNVNVKDKDISIARKSSPEDKKFSEVFFDSAGAEFLFTQKKAEEDVPEILENWSEEFRKLREIDGLTNEGIAYLLNWLFNDPSEDAIFWRKQIRTPSKLRKKNKEGSQYWRVLVLKIKDAAARQKSAATPKFETF